VLALEVILASKQCRTIYSDVMSEPNAANPTEGDNSSQSGHPDPLGADPGNRDAGRGNQDTGRGISDKTNMVAMLAVLIPAVTLPYIVAVLAGRSVIGATLIAAAIALTFVAIMTSTKWIQVVATMGLAAIIFAGGCIIIWGPSAWLGLTEVASITMIEPTPAEASSQPGCMTVTFSGTPPTGDVYIVANREQGNPRYFFQGIVVQDPVTHDWSTRIQIGSSNKKDGGNLFNIYVYFLNETSANYLTNAVPLNGATNWSSLVPPPGAILAGGIDVHRDHGNKTCSSGP
jgi:hypothetical protein